MDIVKKGGGVPVDPRPKIWIKQKETKTSYNLSVKLFRNVCMPIYFLLICLGYIVWQPFFASINQLV